MEHTTFKTSFNQDDMKVIYDVVHETMWKLIDNNRFSERTSFYTPACDTFHQRFFLKNGTPASLMIRFENDKAIAEYAFSNDATNGHNVLSHGHFEIFAATAKTQLISEYHLMEAMSDSMPQWDIKDPYTLPESSEFFTFS